jgi:hypothetical protein
MPGTANSRMSYRVAVLLFTALCAGGLFIILLALGIPFGLQHAGALSYFAAVTLALHRWQENALLTDPKGFINRFMAGMVIKMMLSMVVLLVVLVSIPRSMVLVTALPFMALYLAYLVFSTLRLSTKLRQLHP